MENLSEKYAEKILKSMVYDYDFNFIISTPDDNMILFEIDTNKIDVENNQIELHLELSENEKVITVSCYKRSEDYDIIGYYHITDNEFIKSSSFWETMFTEHLLF
jgi:hypothetical protein